MSYSLQQKRKSRKPNFENLLSVACYQPIAIGVSYFGPPTSLKVESQKLKAESQKLKAESQKQKVKSRKQIVQPHTSDNRQLITDNYFLSIA
jgi:hypothetical protein